MEDLLAVGCLILAIAFNGVLLLSNHWSVGANEFFAFATLKEDQIEQCTHVKVRVDNKKQNTVKRHIVPLLTHSVELLKGKVNKSNQLEIQKKKFIYSKERKTFQQIPYPVQESIQYYQDWEGISTDLEIKKGDLIWGPNKMSVPIP